MAAVEDAVAVGGDADNLTSAAVVGAGTDRFMFAAGTARDEYPIEVRYGGSAGTLLTQEGADLGFAFDQTGSGKLNTWAIAPGPLGSTTFYIELAAPRTLAGGCILLSGVDQTTPLDTEQAGPDNEFSFDQDRAVALTVTGLTPGQLVVAALGIQNVDHAGAGDVTAVTAGANTVVEAFAVGGADPGDVQAAIALLSGVSAGTSLTLNATISSTAGGLVTWRITAFPVIDAAGAAAAAGPLVGSIPLKSKLQGLVS
jgi:hypothetical protein